jgi:hypothetical protein
MSEGQPFYTAEFFYNRTWEGIEELLFLAEQEQNRHYVLIQKCIKENRVFHMKNYKALEGVVTALRWVLGDKTITKKIVLGREQK